MFEIRVEFDSGPNLVFRSEMRLAEISQSSEDRIVINLDFHSFPDARDVETGRRQTAQMSRNRRSSTRIRLIRNLKIKEKENLKNTMGKFETFFSRRSAIYSQ